MVRLLAELNVCPRCNERFDDAVKFCPRDGAALQIVGPDPYIGQTLMGQFELREPLGRGSMGSVYRAWQTGMERWVAVKILHPQLVRDPSVVKRFEREARAVARLSHPNIVTMFVVGETDAGIPFLVMEHVDGEALSVTLEARSLGQDRSVRIVRQIASALAEAHAAGIVHRDLKPANILLTQRRRAADFVKILDYGIAKIIGGDSMGGETDLTKEGAIFGTPHYLSPEQASGGAIDHRADIYSLGVILYRMVVGRLPFAGGGMQALLGHMNDPVPHPNDVAPGIDERLATIIMRCLEKQPDRRFATAEDLADRLDELAAGSTLTPWASGVRPNAARSAPPDAGTVVGGVIDSGSGGVAATVLGAQGQLATGAPRGAPPISRAVPGSDRGPAVTVAAYRPELPASLRTKRQSEPAGAVAGGAEEDGFTLGRELVVSAPLSLDGTDSLAIQTHKTSLLRTIALTMALVVVGGGAGFAVYLWRAKADDVSAPVQPASKTRADAGIATVPRPVGDDGRSGPGVSHTIIVSQGGYAFQAVVPERIVVGVEYEIILEAWDPAGEPLSVPEIVVTVEEPGGIERGLSAKPTDKSGRFRFTRSFRLPGTHYLHVFPPTGNTNVKLWLDVVATRKR